MSTGRGSLLIVPKDCENDFNGVVSLSIASCSMVDVTESKPFHFICFVFVFIINIQLRSLRCINKFIIIEFAILNFQFYSTR